MPKRAVHTPASTDAREQEVAAILKESRLARDAGLGLKGDQARTFLAKLRAKARQAVRDTDVEPG